MSQLQAGNATISESAPSNSNEIQWFIRRLKNYMIDEDEPLIKEFQDLLEDPKIEELTVEQIQDYNVKVQKTINICNVLDRFSMKKIESYIRKKKLDNLNRKDSMDSGESMSMSDGTGI